MPSTTTDVKPLVLLVDDDEDSRYLYGEYLTSTAGYRIAEAGDGQEAIDRALEVVPDVVVMDMSLPVIDGREAMRRLRLDPRTSGIPIVALTGYGDVVASREPGVGFQAVLVKPCPPDVLRRAIESILKLRV